MKLVYSHKPNQWVDNDGDDWKSSLSFTPFWNFFSGGMMAVQGSRANQKYDEVSDSNFDATFDVRFA
jgi:hypothetical protein